MKKFGKYLMIFLAVVVFAGTFVYLFQRSRPKEALYEEQEAKVGDIVRSTVVTGKIQPRDEVNIKPQISGIISELYKEAGQMVKKDEIIAKVKVIPDMGSLSSAQSRVRLAEVNMNQAKTNYNREKALYDKELVSADANTFNDGTTIATVADMDDLIFDGNIDETEVGRLSTGMPVKISVGALQDLSFDAILEYISPKATVNNGANQFEIKASVKIPSDVTIRSGYSANAEIVLDQAQGVVTLPESAIQFEGEKTYVMIKEADNYVRRDVQTGLSDGINIEVKDGIKPGDKVRGAQIIIKKNQQ